MLLAKLAKVGSQEVVAAFGRSQVQPAFCQSLGVGVESLLGRTVGVASPRVTAEVAVEPRTDVPQFVKDGRELLVERLIEKARKIEIEQVEELVALVVKKSGTSVPSIATDFGHRSAGESQRSQGRLKAMETFASSLAKSDRHLFHANVPQLRQARSQVAAQIAHGRGEIES